MILTFYLKWNIAMVWSSLKFSLSRKLLTCVFILPTLFFFLFFPPIIHTRKLIPSPHSIFFFRFFLSSFTPWKLILMSCNFWNVIWPILLMANLRKRFSVNKDKHSLIANSYAICNELILLLMSISDRN